MGPRTPVRSAIAAGLSLIGAALVGQLVSGRLGLAVGVCVFIGLAVAWLWPVVQAPLLGKVIVALVICPAIGVMLIRWALSPTDVVMPSPTPLPFSIEAKVGYLSPVNTDKSLFEVGVNILYENDTNERYSVQDFGYWQLGSRFIDGSPQFDSLFQQLRDAADAAVKSDKNRTAFSVGPRSKQVYSTIDATYVGPFGEQKVLLDKPHVARLLKGLDAFYFAGTAVATGNGTITPLKYCGYVTFVGGHPLTYEGPPIGCGY